MSELVLLLFTSLAVARVTRLVVEDTIFDAPRRRVNEWLLVRGGTFATWLMKLIDCPYCVSVWVSLFCTVIIFAAFPVVIAGSTVAAFLLLWMATAAGSLVVYQQFG